MPTAAPTSNLTAITTNSTGTSSSFSRSDHSHAITTATATTITGSNSVGTSTSLARADHNHALGTGVVDLSNLSSNVTSSFIPAGAVMPYGGNSTPSGWLLCDGSLYSRSTYAALFAVIGVSFGNTTSSNFRVPNLAGRVVQGVNNGSGAQDGATGFGNLTGGTALPVTGLGEWRGATTHTLSTLEIPSHSHTTYATQINTTTTTGTGSRLSTLSGTGGNNTGTTNSQGGDQPHNNVQPVLILNYIIKI